MNQMGGSRTETLVKFVLIIVVSLLSFSIGTFVGKQFSDAQYKMASLDENYVGSRNTASKDAPKDEVLSEEEIASLTEEFVNAERESLGEEGHETNSHDTPESNQDNEKAQANDKLAVADAHDEAKAQEKKKVEKIKPVVAAKKSKVVESVADRIADGKAPTAKAKKSRQPTSLPAAAASNTVGKFTVQVASYATESEAKTHSQTLIDGGFSAFYLSAKVKGNTWYRVSVGLFASRKAATDYKQVLMSQAKIGSALVQKIIK